MERNAAVWLFGVPGLMAVMAVGCTPMAPTQQLHVSQRHARNLYTQTRQLAAERDSATQMAQNIAAERDAVSQHVARLESDLNVANQRLENVLAERGRIQQRYVDLLRGDAQSPLSEDATRRFEDLAARYPDLEFDPITGVSRFDADILFDSGSDQLKSSAMPLLQEFADIMSSGQQEQLKILVVGHTDDRRIARPGTQQKHPTNWHLSTNRSNAVILALSKSGIREPRMGAMGYSRFQPTAANSDESGRQLNRRVEIYVLAPDAVIAGRDPGTWRG